MSVPQVLAGYPQLQMNSSPSEIPSGYSANIEDPNATPFSDKVLNQALNAPSAEMPKIENNLFPNLLMGAVGAAAVYGGVKGIQSLTNGGKTDKEKDKEKDTDTGTDKKIGIGQRIGGAVRDGLGSAVQGLLGGKGKIPTTAHPKPKVHADKPAAHASTPTESNSRPGLERQSAQRHLESKNDSETKSPKAGTTARTTAESLAIEPAPVAHAGGTPAESKPRPGLERQGGQRHLGIEKDSETTLAPTPAPAGGIGRPLLTQGSGDSSFQLNTNSASSGAKPDKKDKFDLNGLLNNLASYKNKDKEYTDGEMHVKYDFRNLFNGDAEKNKNTYRNFMREAHPDKNLEKKIDGEIFTDLKFAYEKSKEKI